MADIEDLIRVVNDLNLDVFTYLQDQTGDRADELAQQGKHAWRVLQDVLDAPADPAGERVVEYAKKAIQMSMDVLHQHPPPGITAEPPPRHYDQ